MFGESERPPDEWKVLSVKYRGHLSFGYIGKKKMG